MNSNFLTITSNFQDSVINEESSIPNIPKSPSMPFSFLTNFSPFQKPPKKQLRLLNLKQCNPTDNYSHNNSIFEKIKLEISIDLIEKFFSFRKEVDSKKISNQKIIQCPFEINKIIFISKTFFILGTTLLKFLRSPYDFQTVNRLIEVIKKIGCLVNKEEGIDHFQHFFEYEFVDSLVKLFPNENELKIIKEYKEATKGIVDNESQTFTFLFDIIEIMDITEIIINLRNLLSIKNEIESLILKLRSVINCYKVIINDHSIKLILNVILEIHNQVLIQNDKVRINCFDIRSLENIANFRPFVQIQNIKNLIDLIIQIIINNYGQILKSEFDFTIIRQLQNFDIDEFNSEIERLNMVNSFNYLLKIIKNQNFNNRIGNLITQVDELMKELNSIHLIESQKKLEIVKFLCLPINIDSKSLFQSIRILENFVSLVIDTYNQKLVEKKHISNLKSKSKDEVKFEIKSDKSVPVKLLNNSKKQFSSIPDNQYHNGLGLRYNI